MSAKTPLSVEEREVAATKAHATYSGGLWPWVFKIAILGVLDAGALYAALVLLNENSWGALAAVVIGTAILNIIFIPPNRFLPAKYLAPGLVFLLIFQVLAIIYTTYIAFTNQSDGHILNRDDAIAAVMAQKVERVPDSPSYKSAVAEKDGQLWLIVIDPATKATSAGSNDTPLAEVTGVELSATGAPKAAEGFTVLSFADVVKRTQEVRALRVPITDDPNDGYLSTTTGTSAFIFRSTITYDSAKNAMVGSDGTIFPDGGRGSFLNPDGTELTPGWKVGIGFENFTKAFTDKAIAQPLMRVMAWTFAFAILSVLTTFALGLFLAIMFNEPRMRGQKWYRVAMILPYAFPGFLSGLVWAGLFNQEFGFINQILLNGAAIPWLTDPWLGKLAILIVNLWLGFPYMFLVATGALQSIPDEALEAAKVDGASPWQTFMQIKLPLLMIPLAPLLISSFAFNFNNFNLIYMLTRGGPQFADTALNVGSTDILISMVYKVAGFDGGRHDFGLASALSIIVFLIVGSISYLGFRQTKTLENLA